MVSAFMSTDVKVYNTDFNCMLHTVNSSMMVVVGPNFHLVTTPSLSELPEAKDMDIEIQVLKDQDLPNHTVNGDGECS